MAVRDDKGSTFCSNGDYSLIAVDSQRRLKTTTSAAAPAPTFMDTAGIFTAANSATAYSPFWETPRLSGTIFGFACQRFDAEVNLYNYRSRFHSPAVGRFLQPDPLGYAAGDMNLYAYVGSDPANFFDPLGLRRASPAGFIGPQQLGDITISAPKMSPEGT